MSYYLLPRTSIIIHKYIDCIEKEDVPKPVISNSLSSYLYDTKQLLDEREKDWDIFKNTLTHMNISTPPCHSKRSVFQNISHYLGHILK